MHLGRPTASTTKQLRSSMKDVFHVQRWNQLVVEVLASMHGLQQFWLVTLPLDITQSMALCCKMHGILNSRHRGAGVGGGWGGWRPIRRDQCMSEQGKCQAYLYEGRGQIVPNDIALGLSIASFTAGIFLLIVLYRSAVMSGVYGSVIHQAVVSRSKCYTHALAMLRKDLAIILALSTSYVLTHSLLRCKVQASEGWTM